MDAFLQAHGVLRVDSFDELARVAVLARLGRRPGRAAAPSGVVIIGSSGGQAAVASDLATRDGLDLAPLTGATRKVLLESVAPGSFTENPLDLIGRPGAKAGIGQVYSAVFSDETVGFALSPWSVVFPDDSDGRRTHRASLQLAADAARESGTPTVISSLTLVPWTDWILALRRDNPHIAVVRGIDMTIRALSRLFPAPAGPPAGPAPRGPGPGTARPWWGGRGGEIEGRQILARLGLPVAAGHAAASADEAARLMRELPAPVVVKLDLRGVPHKDQVGAVTVGCRTPADVRRAVEESYRRMAEHGIGASQVLGILVEEQLTGTEVLVGLSHSGLGRFLTVGRRRDPGRPGQRGPDRAAARHPRGPGAARRRRSCSRPALVIRGWWLPSTSSSDCARSSRAVAWPATRRSRSTRCSCPPGGPRSPTCCWCPHERPDRAGPDRARPDRGAARHPA